MFLSEEKLAEQDKRTAREMREKAKPMPLRFFSSDGNNLERMGQSLFGKKRRGESSGGSRKKR